MSDPDSHHSPDEETATVVAIGRLWAAYADIVSRRSWAELDGLFLPEAVVDLHVAGRDPFQLQGPKAVGDFIGSAIADMTFFQFVPLNHVVDVAPGAREASGRLWMSELRQFSGWGHFTQVWGLYTDTLVLTDRPDDPFRGWRLAHRRYETLARTGPDLDVAG